MRALYAAGAQSQLRLLLDQDDARTLTRNLQYHDYLVAARQLKMQSYLDAIQRITQIEKDIAANLIELQALQKNLQDENTQLHAERAARQKLIDTADADLKTKGGTLEQLNQDRNALQKVITQIEQQRALAIAQEEKRQRQAQLEKEQQEKEQQQQAEQTKNRTETKPAASAYSAEDLARLQTQSFTQRKGKMQWPTQGQLENRFGDQRQGSVQWDGLRINAANGAPVLAVHGGRVMYADALTGQGLLLVLDHGDGYMSLYAHNDMLLREVGEWVKPGDEIARVGNSGGEKNPALYFEIRKDGNPINPLPWLSKK
ncbi:MAG: peptidoglycan DD-metalloendopeptidase family protein [Pseudomonadales bacterium]